MAKEPKLQNLNEYGAANKAAEALDKDNVDTENLNESGAAKTESGVVFVFANLQSGQSFRLPSGPTVTISGVPVSRLKDADGNSFAGGKYGVTKVSADQWDEVMKVYGQMRFFKTGLVFSAPTLERGKAMARERGGLRHGYEPVDPESKRAKTTPNKED